MFKFLAVLGVFTSSLAFGGHLDLQISPENFGRYVMVIEGSKAGTLDLKAMKSASELGGMIYRNQTGDRYCILRFKQNPDLSRFRVYGITDVKFHDEGSFSLLFQPLDPTFKKLQCYGFSEKAPSFQEVADLLAPDFLTEVDSAKNTLTIYRIVSGYNLDAGFVQFRKDLENAWKSRKDESDSWKDALSYKYGPKTWNAYDQEWRHVVSIVKDHVRPIKKGN
jgi:hypothetical protein